MTTAVIITAMTVVMKVIVTTITMVVVDNNYNDDHNNRDGNVHNDGGGNKFKIFYNDTHTHHWAWFAWNAEDEHHNYRETFVSEAHSRKLLPALPILLSELFPELEIWEVQEAVPRMQKKLPDTYYKRMRHGPVQYKSKKNGLSHDLQMGLLAYNIFVLCPAFYFIPKTTSPS